MEKVLEAIDQERRHEEERHEAKMGELARIEEMIRNVNGDAPQAGPPQVPAEASSLVKPSTSPPSSPPAALKNAAALEKATSRPVREAAILAYVKSHPGCKQKEIKEAMPGIPHPSLSRLCLDMVVEEKMRGVGERKLRRYFPSGYSLNESTESPPPKESPGDLLKPVGSGPSELLPKTPPEAKVWEEIQAQARTAPGLAVRCKMTVSEIENILAGMVRRGMVERDTSTPQPTFRATEAAKAVSA